MQSQSPDFFIFGGERTGTTLLAGLVSSHPELIVINDTFIFQILNDVLRSPLEHGLRAGLAHVLSSPRAIARADGPALPPIHTQMSVNFVTRFRDALELRYRSRPQSKWLVAYADALSRYSMPTRPIPLGILIGQVLKTLTPTELTPRRLFGEKTPIHSYQANWLREAYPHAPMIVLLRHPVTAVSALMKRRGRSLRRSLAIYRSFYEEALWDFLVGETALTLRYEDVVRDTPRALNLAWSHLGVDTIDPPETFRYYVRRDYIGLRVDPSRDRVLQAYLTNDQRRAVVLQCQNLIERFYPDEAIS